MTLLSRGAGVSGGANVDLNADLPLAVDLDGTICLADTLAWLRARCADTSAEWEARRLEALARNKQSEKIFLWEQVGLDLDTLPFDAPLLAELAAEQAKGRSLVLVTGSAQGFADAVVDRFPFFAAARGSRPEINLTGPRKAAALVAEFGLRGFDYLGDSLADLPVWAAARQGYVVVRSTTPDFDIPAGVVRLTSDLAVQPPPGHRQLWATGDNWSPDTLTPVSPP